MIGYEYILTEIIHIVITIIISAIIVVSLFFLCICIFLLNIHKIKKPIKIDITL